MQTTNLENLGTINKNKVVLETVNASIVIFFSYETPVSFIYRNFTTDERIDVTRRNDWGSTTGKLLNECEPDKTKRIEGVEFEKLLAEALTKL